MFIIELEYEPLLLPAFVTGTDQRIATLELLTMKRELERAIVQCLAERYFIIFIVQWREAAAIRRILPPG